MAPPLGRASGRGAPLFVASEEGAAGYLSTIKEGDCNPCTVPGGTGYWLSNVNGAGHPADAGHGHLPCTLRPCDGCRTLRAPCADASRAYAARCS
jgi:hypothetical protein